MQRFKFIVSPPWDDTVDVLFEVEACDSNHALKQLCDRFRAMYGTDLYAWREV